jgi:hypothetical protein
MEDEGSFCGFELLIGPMQLVTGGLFLAAGAVPHDASFGLKAAAAFGAPLLWAVGSFAISRAAVTFRRRVIGPRGGTVVPDPRKLKRNRAVVMGVLVLVLIAIWGVDPRKLSGVMSVGVPAFFPVIYLVAGIQSRRIEPFCLAAAAAGFGFWAYLVGGGFDGALWTMLWLGGATLAAGLFRLRRFLRANPIGHL